MSYCLHTTFCQQVLYDGDCKICAIEIAGLKWLTRKRDTVLFVDITDMNYEPLNNGGVTYEDAMKEMHVIDPDGKVNIQGCIFFKYILFMSAGCW